MNIARDFPGEAAFLHGQPDGAAEQACTDDGDFLELHAAVNSGRKILLNHEIYEPRGHLSYAGGHAALRHASKTFCVFNAHIGQSSLRWPEKIWFAKLRNIFDSCDVAGLSPDSVKGYLCETGLAKELQPSL